MVREFLNVVHHAIQLPLTIHLGFSAQGKPIQSFVAAQIAEHGFHCREATGDHVSTRVGIDFDFHLVSFAGSAALA